MSAPRRLTWNVRIGDGGGIDTPCLAFTATFDVDQPVATGSLTMRAPRPVQVQLGVPVMVYGGYDDAVYPLFSGRVATDDATFGEQGGMCTVNLEGWGKLLYYANSAEVGFNGPLSLNVWWRSLCNYRTVPHYHADATTDTNGDTIMLGSNPDIRNGWIPISTQASPGADMAREAKLFGYRSFETPLGMRLQRVSGLPTKSYENLVQYSEGQNVMEVGRSRTLAKMVNYWDIYGAEYTAADTSEVAIHSFGTPIQGDPRLGPDGINRDEIRDSDLVTTTLADACRNAHEIDYSTPYVRFRWDAVGGDPERIPGEQVAVFSTTVDDPIDIFGIPIPLPRSLWLMRVEHHISDRGFTTSMEGWAGNGHALPAGDDCTVTTLLGSQGVHIGNEYLYHYRNPNPRGTQYDIPFTIPSDYSTATVRYDGHGTNSFQFNENSEASRFEVLHNGERTASGVMPRLDENLERRYDYTQNAHWERGVVPLSGSLKAGNNIFRIIAGEDHDVGDVDDYELKNIQITLCGVGAPIVVGG